MATCPQKQWPLGQQEASMSSSRPSKEGARSSGEQSPPRHTPRSPEEGSFASGLGHCPVPHIVLDVSPRQPIESPGVHTYRSGSPYLASLSPYKQDARSPTMHWQNVQLPSCPTPLPCTQPCWSAQQLLVGHSPSCRHGPQVSSPPLPHLPTTQYEVSPGTAFVSSNIPAHPTMA